MTTPLTPATFALLLALTEGEQHGYGLIDAVRGLTGGSLVLGPGTLYRTLQRMRLDEFVIEVDRDEAAVLADRRAERRRRYRITAPGLAAVRAEAHRLAALLASDTAQAVLRGAAGTTTLRSVSNSTAKFTRSCSTAPNETAPPRG